MSEIVTCPKCLVKIEIDDPYPFCKCFNTWQEFDNYYWSKVTFSDIELEDYRNYCETFIKNKE